MPSKAKDHYDDLEIHPPAPSRVKTDTGRALQHVDIEHVQVEDDPRKWSVMRKNTTLAMIASASLIATLGLNIYNPAIKQIMQDLNANDAEIALTISLCIIFQGSAPLFWASITEIKGRKVVYVSSFAFYIASTAICGSANSIGLLIGMRVLQACGSAAVFTIGAGTLADIFEPKERGSKLGIYYAAPLLGPALGPILGGILTKAWSWRSTFYILTVFGAVVFIAFLLFKDTFRRERSLSYQSAVARLRTRQLAEKKAEISTESSRKLSSEEKDADATEGHDNLGGRERDAIGGVYDNDKREQGAHWTGKDSKESVKDVKLSLMDINPFPQVVQIFMRKNNIAIYFPSSLLFALSYSISYTCSVTLFAPPYNYDALKVGLVLLSFGVGESIAGSLLGGKWSDRTLAKIKKANGGMRLESTKLAMPVLPAAILAYAWLADKHVHVSGLIVALFFLGLSSIWIYSSTLAYIVDSNAGRSSTAVAANSFSRGLAGFVASEAAIPIQHAIGDGGLYTIWTGLCIVLELVILLVIARGGKWREEREEKERTRMESAFQWR